MSEPLTALQGRTAMAAVQIADAGPRGMIALRVDLADPAVGSALHDTTGLAVPGVRQILFHGARSAAWMSPDELLLLTDYSEVGSVISALGGALGSMPHLVADVSDARAIISLNWRGVREILAKGAPVDFRTRAFQPGEVRRTRLGQVAAAFWLHDEEHAELICFRSVAGFVFDWLEVAARTGTLPDHF